MKKTILILLVILASVVAFDAQAKPFIAKLSKAKPYTCVFFYWGNNTMAQTSWVRDAPFQTEVWGKNGYGQLCALWNDNTTTVDVGIWYGENAYAQACSAINYPMQCNTTWDSIYAVNTQTGFADWTTELKLKGTDGIYRSHISNCDHSCDPGDEVTLIVERGCSQF
jgi:hypothetical protein